MSVSHSSQNEINPSNLYTPTKSRKCEGSFVSNVTKQIEIPRRALCLFGWNKTWRTRLATLFPVWKWEGKSVEQQQVLSSDVCQDICLLSDRRQICQSSLTHPVLSESIFMPDHSDRSETSGLLCEAVSWAADQRFTFSLPNISQGTSVACLCHFWLCVHELCLLLLLRRTFLTSAVVFKMNQTAQQFYHRLVQHSTRT